MLIQLFRSLFAKPPAEPRPALARSNSEILGGEAESDESPTLLELHLSKRGKVSDKWEAYFAVYERLFRPFRHRPVTLLEIGVQNGGSLEVWAAYFGGAETIIGCDIDPLCGKLRYADARIHVVVGDATAPATRDRLLSIAPSLDVVIDDGSHTSQDIVAAFLAYFPALKDGGLFVIEDMLAVYRPVKDGGVLTPTSAQEFFKLLTDVLNVEHWGGRMEADQLLSRFTSKAPDWLSTIESIEFRNSMIVIRKGSSQLGRRIVAGTEASVFPGSLRHVRP